MSHILSIAADRSARGIHVAGSAAYRRQEAYAHLLGELHIVGLTLAADGFTRIEAGPLSIYPTQSRSRIRAIFDAVRIAHALPKPDVISTQDPYATGLVGYWLARRLNVPLHVQVHTDTFDPAYIRFSLGNRVRSWVARFVLRRASRIRVVSDRVKRSLVNNGIAAPITVLPIYVDVAAQKETRTKQSLEQRFSRYKTKFLFVGRIEAEKRPDLAIRAFAEGAGRHDCLVVVGNGTMLPSLQSLAERLGIADRVFFEGAHDAAPYFALADVVLVTSAYEGYGLVMIEALAAGKPVIATDVGIAPEVGALVTDAAHFAETIRLWLANGPRTASLPPYPYRSREEYVSAYCADITAS